MCVVNKGLKLCPTTCFLNTDIHSEKYCSTESYWATIPAVPTSNSSTMPGDNDDLPDPRGEPDPDPSNVEASGNDDSTNLRVVRRQRKAAITRHLGTLERLMAEGDVTGVQQRLRTLKLSFTDFESVHDDFNKTLTDVDLMDESDDWFRQVESNYIGGVKTANTWLSGKINVSNDKPGPSKFSDPHSINHDLFNLLSIPKLEIDKFNGEPSEYKSFMAVFEESVASKVNDGNIKLTRLLQYTTGPAKEAIRNCAILGGDKGFRQAMEILYNRFGNDHLISRTIINDLKSGKPVTKAIEIQQLADELCTAYSVLNSLNKMQEIDNQYTIISILQRCSVHVQRRWRNTALEFKRNNDEYPNFMHLVKFVQQLAADSGDPVYGSEVSSLFKGNKSKSSSCFSATSDVANAGIASKKSNHNHTRKHNRVQVCVLCEEEHRLNECTKFKSMSPCDRLNVVKCNKLCFNCFRSNHFVGQCKDPIKCSVCGRKHSRFIHIDSPNGVDDVSNKSEVSGNINDNVTVASTNAFGSTVYLPIVHVMVNGVRVLGLLDTGSTNTFITESLARKLQLKGKTHSFVMNTVSDCRHADSVSVSATLSNSDGSFVQDVSNILVVQNIPARYPSVKIDVQKYSHLQNISIPDIQPNSQVDLLIGMDNSDILIPLEVRQGRKTRNEPYATRSVFGWALNGLMGNCISSRNVCTNFVQLESQIDRLWDQSSSDVDELGLSVEDQEVLDLWDSNVARDGNHYVLPIPWRQRELKFPNNKCVVESRLVSLKRRLQRTGLYKRYDENIDKMIDKGYVERVPNDELMLNDGTVWYLPHHPVISVARPDKVRPVFDCAASYRGVSLNSQCLQGPILTNNLIDVLLRFRQYQYAITADIESMYLQVRIPPRDRNALRFLWYEDESMIELRSVSHLFGGKWSGSASAYALLRTIKDNPCSRLVQNVVERSFYVDDLLRSAQSLSEAEEVITGTQQILATGGFNLTKFTVNDNALIEIIDSKDRAQDVRELLPDTVSRALGIKWVVMDDVFTYSCKAPKCDSTISRRAMLSFVSSVYDPLGLISPILLPGKILFQEATRLKISWDNDVPMNLFDRWKSWSNSLSLLDRLRFDRCVLPRGFENGVCELHHFSDASSLAYGSCSYLRVINEEGKLHVSLLASKCRLAPLKQTTIPRLELCAALSAVQLDQLMRRELDIQFVDSYFWTDSQIVLAYIANEKRRFKVYVSNRVSQIRQGSSVKQWHYVRGNENPADILSRGCEVDSLPSSWYHGPDFLHKYKSEWLSVCDVNVPIDDPELVKEQTVGVHTVSVVVDTGVIHPLLSLIDHYSSYYRLKKAVAWLLRFKLYLREKRLIKGVVTLDEMIAAERYILIYVQGQTYSDDIRDLRTKNSVKLSSSLCKLSPKLSDGMIVVGGRLSRAQIPAESKSPIILPKNHKISRMVALEYHNYAHLGVEWVLSRLRSRYWIVNARSIVKKLRFSCVVCKRLYGKPMSQKMSDLPEKRCEPYVSPFSCVGVDIFGPFYVKQARSHVKRYGCVFSCLSSRALHIEKLDDLSTGSLINGLIRFSARRGPVQRIYCDNGTNLVGAKNELSKSLRSLNRGAVIASARRMDIDWKFNPPLASHYGGFYERMIRTIRRVLHAILSKNDRLSDDILSTVFCECENIINSRPLTKCSDDANDSDPITPNHLLLLQGNYSFPWNRSDNCDVYQKQWRHAQLIVSQFWKRWLREYIPELNQRQKWFSEKANLCKGDIVLVVDANAPRGQWPLGKVVSVNVSRDGFVRSARVQTKLTQLVRPITKLVHLEGNS